MTAAERADEIQVRLNTALTQCRATNMVPDIDVAPVVGAPDGAVELRVSGTCIVTVNRAMATIETVGSPIELAQRWASSIRDNLALLSVPAEAVLPSGAPTADTAGH